MAVVGALDTKRNIKKRNSRKIRIGNVFVETILLAVPTLSHQVILGTDWLNQNEVIIDFCKKNNTFR